MFKISDIVNGYLYIKNEQVPFEFDKSSFKLKLYFDFATWEDESNPIKVLERYFADSDPKATKEVDYIEFKGCTSDRKNICIKAVNIPNERDGFKVYPCVWVYISTTTLDNNHIYGLRIEGDTIDSYFSPVGVFRANLKYSEEKKGYDEFNINAKSTNSEKCGSINNDEITIQAIATYRSNNNVPLISSSRLLMKFEKPVSLSEAESNCLNIYHVFQILNYRKNIAIDDFIVLSKNENGEIFTCGVMSANLRKFDNESEKNNSNCIKHSHIKENLGKMIKMYSEGTIINAYLPESYSDRRIYEISRIYMILSDFDYQFKKVNTDNCKSNTLVNTKKRISNIISSLINEESSVSEKVDLCRIKEMVNSVSNGLSYKKSLDLAFKNNEDIMKIFVGKYFQEDYSEATNIIVKQISDIRHSFSHGSLNIDITQENLNSICIIERLNYALMLKRIGLENKMIIDGIKTLFHE